VAPRPSCAYSSGMTDPLPTPAVPCPVCGAGVHPDGTPMPCVALDGRPFPQGHSERRETTPTHDALAAAPAWDLDAIRTTWLRECGACDAGMATACVCPDGDPRTVILALVTRVESAEGRLAAVVEATRG
jgi:hypothetical protein